MTPLAARACRAGTRCPGWRARALARRGRARLPAVGRWAKPWKTPERCADCPGEGSPSQPCHPEARRRFWRGGAGTSCGCANARPREARPAHGSRGCGLVRATRAPGSLVRLCRRQCRRLLTTSRRGPWGSAREAGPREARRRTTSARRTRRAEGHGATGRSPSQRCRQKPATLLEIVMQAWRPLEAADRRDHRSANRRWART